MVHPVEFAPSTRIAVAALVVTKPVGIVQVPAAIVQYSNFIDPIVAS